MIDVSSLSRRPVYMDHHATTPVDPRVLEAMLPYFNQAFGNAASTDHEYGAQAKQAVDVSREQIARSINARPEEIIFTSGATESNNLAILGAVKNLSRCGNHIITCVTEHPAILDPCKYLENNGYDITYIPVDSSGLIYPDDIREAITPKTILISVMTANNEIGTLQPITEIGLIAKDHEVLFHTDATQAIGYIPINVENMGIDLLSLSGHKIYGPKGIGALYVRKVKPRVKLSPIIHGGGHQMGMRSGTLNVPGIVGLGEAVDIVSKESESESSRVSGLRDSLLNGLKERVENIQVNGHSTMRLPNNIILMLPLRE